VIKRWVRRLLFALLGLLLLCVVALATLLGSEPGTRLLLAVVSDLSAGQLRLAGSRGALLDHVSIDRLSLTLPDEGLLEIDAVELDWRPSTLFAQRLSLDLVRADGVRLRPPSGAAQTPPAPTTDAPFAGVELPLTIRLERLHLGHFELLDATGAQTLVEALDLGQVEAAGDGVRIGQLQLASPFGSVELQGEVGLMPSRQSELTLAWRVTLEALAAPLEGHGTLSGTLQGYHLEQQLTAPTTLRVEASVEQPLVIEQLSWRAAIDLSKTQVARIVDLGRSLEVDAKLTAHGNLAAIDATLDGRVVDGEFGPLDLSLKAGLDQPKVRIDQLHLTTPSGNQLTLNGQVALAHDTEPSSVNLSGHWKALRWPLQASPEQAEALLPYGALSVTGDLDHYLVRLAAELRGHDIPPTELDLNGHGSLSAFTLDPLRVRLLQGQVVAKGEVSWDPVLTFNQTLQAEGINPGAQWLDWPGRLGLQLDAKGGLKGDQFQLDANLAQLTGTLRGYPVSAQAQSRLRGERIEVKGLQLASGSAKLSADATLDKGIQAHWAIDAPELGHLLPELSGALQGQGSVEGALQTPHLRARLNGHEVAYTETRLEGLDATVDLDLAGRAPWHLNLSLLNLHSAGQLFTLTEVSADGSAAEHNITLSTATGDQRIYQMMASGGLANGAWRGTLHDARYRSPYSHNWKQLDGPSPLTLAADQAKLAPWCWGNGEARLCLSADWRGSNGGTARVTADGLPLDLFRAYFPEDTQFAGNADLDAQLRLTTAGELHGTRLALSVPTLLTTLTLSDGDQQTLESRDIEVGLAVTPEALSANYSLDFLDTGHLEGEARLPNWSLHDPVRPDQPLRGATRVTLEDMQILSTLVPDLTEPKGKLDVAVRLAGNLTHPVLDGDGHLSDASLRIPRLGIGLKQIDFTLKRLEDANGLQLAGGLVSGKGKLKVEGRFALESAQAWSLVATVKGDRVELARIPEAYLLASPDVRIDAEPGSLKLTGRLTIPEAEIQIVTPSTSSTSASSDIVVVDTGEDEGSAIAITTDLEVVIGDKVKLEGEGFKGRIAGNLRVHEQPGQVALGTGELQVYDGRFRAYGQDLTIEQGRVIFAGTPLADPGLDLRAIRTNIETRVGITVTGRASKPRIELFSDDAMSDSDRLSYLVLGRPMDQTSGEEQQGLSQAALAIGLAGGDAIARDIGRNLGLEEVGIDNGTSPNSSALVLGKYLSPRLYVRYAIGITEDVNTLQMRYKINKFLSLQTETGVESGADLVYTFEK